VVLVNAHPRLLARRSELGYTDRPAQAMPHEPEAVPSDAQRRITDDARRRASQRELDAYRSFASIVFPALLELGRGLDRAYASDLRAVARQVERIGRRLDSA